MNIHIFQSGHINENNLNTFINGNQRKPIIITGPQACGKTHNADKLAILYGFSVVLDGWEPGDNIPLGTMALTNVHYSEIPDGDYDIHQYEKIFPFDRNQLPLA